MFRTGLIAAFLAVAFTATLWAQDKPKTTAEKLLGKWKLVKSGENLPEGVVATLELAKESKLKLTIEFKGQVQNVDGTYKLDGDKKIKITMKQGEKEQTETLKIEKLTDDELVTLDEKDKKDEFKRVKEEKKKEEKK